MPPVTRSKQSFLSDCAHSHHAGPSAGSRAADSSLTGETALSVDHEERTEPARPLHYISLVNDGQHFKLNTRENIFQKIKFLLIEKYIK